ncbi:uncharacterized protein LOC110856347 isoform X2 [Folsomia candida]|uniref:uncharacterized protein LOC110856347 isoform X2 n=1 Tax=Folsomia candida TaxID=158441 RepID=UPI001604EF0F|nr:uncharacterized protein LOC110856347 isoform X2 [Folsomia candida]
MASPQKKAGFERILKEMKDQQVVLLDEIREEEELLRKSMELILTSKEKIATKKLALQDRLFITELLEQKLYDLRVAPQNSQREIDEPESVEGDVRVATPPTRRSSGTGNFVGVNGTHVGDNSRAFDYNMGTISVANRLASN